MRTGGIRVVSLAIEPRAYSPAERGETPVPPLRACPIADPHLSTVFLCVHTPIRSIPVIFQTANNRGRCACVRPRDPNTCATELAVKKGKAAVIVGAQWGDEGKGKIVDVLSEGFPVVARYAG